LSHAGNHFLFGGEVVAKPVFIERETIAETARAAATAAAALLCAKFAVAQHQLSVLYRQRCHDAVAVAQVVIEMETVDAVVCRKTRTLDRVNVSAAVVSVAPVITVTSAVAVNDVRSWLIAVQYSDT
jgi:hypothetical protein